MNEEHTSGDCIKEALIDEYLKKHPGVSRSQVIGRFRNGRVVFETIDKVMASLSQPSSSQQERELIWKEQRVQEDKRYQACKLSIQSCKHIINFLFTSSMAAFGLAEKNENLSYLSRSEKVIVSRAYDLHGIKKEFTDLLDGTRVPTRSGVRDIVRRYLQAFLDQLRSQHGIYKREYRLGDRLTEDSRQFIKKNIAAIKSKVKSGTLKTICKAYVVAKKVLNQTVSEPTEISIDALEAALEEMGESLDQRRSQIQVLEKVIAFMETLVKELEEEEQPEQEQAAQPAEEKPQGGKFRRMVFVTKLFGRR